VSDTLFPPRVVILENAIRPYAWGSPSVIPSLLGREPDLTPAAELWIGAHPDEPSRWQGHPDRPGLDELIATDPVALLGKATVERFGPRLPFLLKLLAAEKSLSLQVHPNLEQAQEGFAAEEARGVPRDAPERNYRDANHKPELLCALTDFDALCGFRPVGQTAELFDALIAHGAAELVTARGLLSGPDGVRATFTSLLELGDAERDTLVSSVTAAAERLRAAGGEWIGPTHAAALAAQDFPSDVGVVLSLLLNYVRLRPGEAIFLGAGQVHAYLRGFGVEILANSDNVLRCGLTAKHVDVAELLRITDFTALSEPKSVVEHVAPGVRRYPVPVPDFVLTELTVRSDQVEAVPVDPVELASSGPHVLICTDGEVALVAAGVEHRLVRGASAFVSAGESPVTVSGVGTAFVASVNL
jgi:mannose-6-phosphate isomerase